MPNASNTAGVLDALAGRGRDRRAARAGGPGAAARASASPTVDAAMRRRRTVPGGRDSTYAGRRVRVAGHRLHRRGRRRDRGRRTTAPPRSVATRSSARGSRRPGSARATRCAWRPACRCTATSSRRRSRPSRPGSGWVARLGQGGLPRPQPRSSASAPAGAHGCSRGLVADGAPAACATARVVAVDGGPSASVVTSGNFSPVLERGIGLGAAGAAAPPRATRGRASSCAVGRSTATCRRAALRGQRRAEVADYLPHTDDEVDEMLAFLGLGLARRALRARAGRGAPGRRARPADGPARARRRRRLRRALAPPTDRRRAT